MDTGVKRPDREADHSSPYSAEVKNAWSCTSTPQYVFMTWYLVNRRNNFTCTLYRSFCRTVPTVCYRLVSNIVKYNALIRHSRDSSVGIALGYGLDYRGCRVRFLTGAGNFSLHHRVQNGSGAHPASYPMGTRGSFLGDKAAGTWSWPLTYSAEIKNA
jgi:hypothetical protein